MPHYDKFDEIPLLIKSIILAIKEIDQIVTYI